MTMWIAAILLTAAAMAWLLLPLWQKRGDSEPSRADFDRAVFRDQLQELDRDLARDVIAPADADAARNEISRRLLQATAAKAQEPKPSRTPAIAIVGVLVVPLVALPLYLQLGSPRLSDVPLSARLENAAQNQDIAALIAKVEDHLAANPNDVQGWMVLAPVYKRAGRWDDAANAYGRVLDLTTPAPETLADYGEMVVYGKQGMVTVEAVRAFDEALKLDPKLPKARYFVGLGLKQEGKTEEAKQVLQSLFADTPANAPWRETLVATLAELGARPPALSNEQMAAGANMTPTERDTMIRSMVDGLETRLKADGNDLEGWQKLIRARSVLNEPDRAKAALAAAREQFKDRPDAIAALDGLAKELGI